MGFRGFIKQEARELLHNRRFWIVSIIQLAFLYLIFNSGFIKYVILYIYTPLRFQSLYSLVFFYAMLSALPFFTMMVSYDSVSSLLAGKGIYYFVANMPRRYFLLGKLAMLALYFTVMNLLVFSIISVYLLVHGSTGFLGIGFVVFMFLSAYSAALLGMYVLISTVTRRTSISIIFSLLVPAVMYILKEKLGVLSIFYHIPKTVGTQNLLVSALALLVYASICYLLAAVFLEVTDL